MGLVDEIKENAEAETTEEFSFRPYEGDATRIISTGSTLLDLSISGGRIRGGGIPAGILVEIYGPSQIGKTAILAEMGASTKIRGGKVIFTDPESRLDKEYAKIYGMDLKKEEYYRPDTVNDMFKIINDMETDPAYPNLVAGDSLSALSTEMEMESEDKMGMKKGKDFSMNFRKNCRRYVDEGKIIALSNQLRNGPNGLIRTGGMAIGFYASVCIQMKVPAQGKHITKEKTINKTKYSKVIGIQSTCRVTKSVDDPYRECSLYILFGIGVDDIRGNLEFLKNHHPDKVYFAVDKEYKRVDAAIQYIEEKDYEEQLREQTMDVWYEIESQFKQNRKPKVRF